MKIVLSITIIMLSLATGWGSTTSPLGVRPNYAIAKINNLHPSWNNWDLNAEGVTCAKWDADKPYEWRRKYGWASFCPPRGPKGQDACGKCLKVRNSGSRELVVTVRIMDQCKNEELDSEEILDLELGSFDLLDPAGSAQIEDGGKLLVDYQFVDCSDELMIDQSAESKNIAFAH